MTRAVTKKQLMEENEKLRIQNKRIVDRGYECNKSLVDHCCKLSNRLRELVIMLEGLQSSGEMSDYYDFSDIKKLYFERNVDIDIPEEIQILEAEVERLKEELKDSTVMNITLR